MYQLVFKHKNLKANLEKRTKIDFREILYNGLIILRSHMGSGMSQRNLAKRLNKLSIICIYFSLHQDSPLFFILVSYSCIRIFWALLRIRIRRIRKIFASWNLIRKNMRIHGSGSQGQNINKKLQKNYSPTPNPNY